MRRHAHSRQTDRRSFCMESSRLRRRASTSLESFLYLHTHTHTWYVYPGYKSTWMHFTLLALCTLRKRSIGRGQTYIRANSARPIAYRRERESRHVGMGSTNNQTITPRMHLTKLIYACTHTPAPAAVAAWQASPETAHPWAYAHPPQSYGQDELEVTV